MEYIAEWFGDLNRRAHWDRIGGFALGIVGGAFIGSRVAPKHRGLGMLAGAAVGCGAAYGTMVALDPSVANL